jgi:FAD binding domain/Berberine and berberine like
MNELSVHVLRTRMTGDFVLPGDGAWFEAKQAWNLAVDQQPSAVALPETPKDVVAVVEFARANGLRVAPQGTGHSAGALAIEGDILLKTERMRGITIDPERRTARFEAGALWGPVADAAAEHGLAALAGSSHDVGVVGYSLGGGISWLARRHGLSANSVVSAEIVTADGRLVHTDAQTRPDLFWALRGGGGNFGVVTALELQLYPITEVYAGVLFFALESGVEVLNAWREWTEEVPDEVTSVGRFLQFPPLPALPEHLRGRSFVAIEAAMIMDEFQASELLQPLRALGPEMDTFATIPVENLKHVHMDPPGPVPGHGDGMLLSEFTPATIDALTRASVGSSLLSVEVRHLGGAVAEARPGNGALAKLDAEYALFAVGPTPTPEAKAVVSADVAAMHEALAPWDAGRRYLNFTEAKVTGQAIWGPETLARLKKVKATWDARNVFRSNHELTPAEAHPARTPARRAPRPLSAPSRIAPQQP